MNTDHYITNRDQQLNYGSWQVEKERSNKENNLFSTYNSTKTEPLFSKVQQGTVRDWDLGGFA